MKSFRRAALIASHLAAATAGAATIPQTIAPKLALAAFGSMAAWNEALQSAPGVERYKKLEKAARQLSSNEFGTLLRGTDNLTDADEKSMEVGALMTAWASVDPRGAMDYAAALPSAQERSEAMASIFMPWLMKNPQDVFFWVKNLPEGPERTHLARTGVMIAQQNPEAALPFVDLLPPEEKGRFRAVIFGRLIETAPTVAVAHLNEMPPGPERASTVEGLARSLGTRDGATAVDWAYQLPDETERAKALGAALNAWANREPEQAYKAATALPDAYSGKANLVDRVISLTALLHAELAAKWVLELPPSQRQTSLAKDVALSLAKGGIRSAMDWAMQLPGFESQDQVLAVLAERWSLDDPASALASCQKDIPEREAVPATKHILREWSRRDRQAALNYTLGQPKGLYRQASLEGLLGTWRELDPGNWNGGFAALPTEDKITILPDLVSALAYRSLDQGRQWCQTLDPSLQPFAYESLSRVWFAKDATTFFYWLKVQPEGPVRDAAISGAATALVVKDPKSGMEWIQSISDNATKLETLARVREELSEKHPDVLRALGPGEPTHP